MVSEASPAFGATGDIGRQFRSTVYVETPRGLSRGALQGQLGVTSGNVCVSGRTSAIGSRAAAASHRRPGRVWWCRTSSRHSGGRPAVRFQGSEIGKSPPRIPDRRFVFSIPRVALSRRRAWMSARSRSRTAAPSGAAVERFRLALEEMQQAAAGRGSDFAPGPQQRGDQGLPVSPPRLALTVRRRRNGESSAGLVAR